MPTVPLVPDLVRLSKLTADFSADAHHIVHQVPVPGQRNALRKEQWKRQRKLGSGSFGAVYLEQCTNGDKEGKVRAVKKIKKPQDCNYYRELEALAYFSYPQYERCFVKSFGWFDSENDIYITMEYFPRGDLHQYLTSPLPENEGQQIVSQLLEGLDFMHESGFAHRDLKPANVLVVEPGPNWWVKIADFGISKRATEGHTALRTLTGTPAFTAPEVLGFGPVDELSDHSYTNAVDIWSTGVITFLILTGELYFKDPRQLRLYAEGKSKFPLENLLSKSVTRPGCDFVKRLMAPMAKDRPDVKQILKDPWVTSMETNIALQSESSNRSRIQTPSSTMLESSPSHKAYNERSGANTAVWSPPEPSARWSTQDSHSRNEGSDHGIPTMIADTTVTQNVAQKGVTPREGGFSSPPNVKVKIDWSVFKTLEGHKAGVERVAFSPNGRLVATASFDGTARLWDVASGVEVKSLPGDGSLVWDVAFSPDGRLVATATWANIVYVWDVASGTETKTLKGHEAGVRSVIFSPNGRLVATASGVRKAMGKTLPMSETYTDLFTLFSKDKTARLWDVASATEIKTLEGHERGLTHIAFSPNGQLVATASDDGTARLWNVNSAVEMKRLRLDSGPLGDSVAFSPGGRLLATASGNIEIWDTASGARIKSLKSNIFALDVAFSPDGQLLASAQYDGRATIWNVESGVEIKTLEGHKGYLNSIAFSPDGRFVATGSDDHTARIWDWDSVAGPKIVDQEHSTKGKLGGKLGRFLGIGK